MSFRHKWKWRSQQHSSPLFFPYINNITIFHIHVYTRHSFAFYTDSHTKIAFIIIGPNIIIFFFFFFLWFLCFAFYLLFVVSPQLLHSIKRLCFCMRNSCFGIQIPISLYWNPSNSRASEDWNNFARLKEATFLGFEFVFFLNSRSCFKLTLKSNSILHSTLRKLHNKMRENSVETLFRC